MLVAVPGHVNEWVTAGWAAEFCGVDQYTPITVRGELVEPPPLWSFDKLRTNGTFPFATHREILPPTRYCATRLSAPRSSPASSTQKWEILSNEAMIRTPLIKR
jgi:hypothetical protein